MELKQCIQIAFIAKMYLMVELHFKVNQLSRTAWHACDLTPWHNVLICAFTWRLASKSFQNQTLNAPALNTLMNSTWIIHYPTLSHVATVLTGIKSYNILFSDSGHMDSLVWVFTICFLHRNIAGEVSSGPNRMISSVSLCTLTLQVSTNYHVLWQSSFPHDAVLQFWFYYSHYWAFLLAVK